jgi:hypothetical protein
MQLGIQLRKLWRSRLVLGVSLAIAVLVTVQSTYRVSLLPPSIKAKALETGTASTHVLVDTPRSTVLDLRQGTYFLEGMTRRAVLLGNIMASLPVREYVARRAGIPADWIRASTPTTPDYPRPVQDPQNQRHTSDVLHPASEYRFKVFANPTVPVLDIYAQGPTAKAAEELGNAAVDGLKDYLAASARMQGVPTRLQVQLKQLGRAHGEVLNPGVRLQATLVLFFFVFALSCASLLGIARIRAGWRAPVQRDDAGGPDVVPTQARRAA